jgi:hypothetical protein
VATVAISEIELAESEEFNLTDARQIKQSTRGAKKKIYMLTPDAFKKCLMRAQRRPGQPVDVTRYADYYLFLEKIVKYYGDYQLTKEQILSAGKDGTIADLQAKMDKMLSKADTIISQNETQSSQINDLQEDLTGARADITGLHSKMDGFATILSQLAISSEVVRSILTKANDPDIMDINVRSPSKGVESLKMVYLITCYSRDHTRMLTRVACRNFKTTPKTINDIISVFVNDLDNEDRLLFHSVSAIALSCDIEINTELRIFKQVFDEMESQPFNRLVKWRAIPIESVDEITTKRDLMVQKLRTAFIMHHQDSLIKYKTSDQTPEEMKVKADAVFQYCTDFTTDTTRYCQQFLDAYVRRALDGTAIWTNRSDMRSSFTHDLVRKASTAHINMKQCDYAKVMLKLRIREFDIEGFLESLMAEQEAALDSDEDFELDSDEEFY